MMILYCQIWKRNGNCFKAEKSYFRDSDCGDDAGSLVKLSNDSNSLDGVDLAFFDNIIDKNVATLLFPNLNFVRTDYYPSHSTAAMIKARIVANNSNGNMLDVENNLNRRITFFINNEIICNFPLGHPLPFTFKSDDITTISSYKICERNAAGTKSETEYHLTENQKKSLDVFEKDNKKTAACTRISRLFWIHTFENEYEKYNKFLEKVSSKHDGKLGCLCICMGPDYDNRQRRTVIKKGLSYGFENVAIIDVNTALYIDVLSQTQYSSEKNEVIFIIHNKNCYIWHKTKTGAKYINRCDSAPESIMLTLKEKAKFSKQSPILFHCINDPERKKYKDLFGNCKIMEYNKSINCANGSLVKAEIMAQNPKFQSLNTSTVFDKEITIKLDKNEVFTINANESLPFSKSIIIGKFGKEAVLQVMQRTKKVEEFGIHCDTFNLSFSADTNGIYTVTTTSMDISEACDSKSKTDMEAIVCVGIDLQRGEMEIYKNKKVLQKVVAANNDNKKRKIEFISTQAAELLNIFDMHKMQKHVKKIAVISDTIAKRKLYCQIWKRYGNTFKADKGYLRESGPGADNENLQKLKNDSNDLEDIDIVFVDSMINERLFQKIFPHLNYQCFKYLSQYAKAALNKSRIIINDPDVDIDDVENNLNRRISLLVDDIIINEIQNIHIL
uniref:Uncharacterized protein n=1 Tax=Panagrolaimus sp. ES5 TaxID=591445 RepID=A0AC34F3C9_9BILA